MAAKVEHEKRVTWAELFFDLVFVFAITEVSALLHKDHSWGGVLRAVVVFAPIWWGWVGTSIHANTRDVDNPPDRIGIFAVGLASFFMALSAPYAYEDRGLIFGAGYFALRLLLAALVFRAPKLSLNSFSVGLLVTGPLFLIGGLLDDTTARTAVWGLAAIIDLAVPLLVRKRLARIRFEPSHLPERFGLFLIIALGESIIGVGHGVGSDLDLTRGLAVAVSFVVTCSLWWVYFVYAADAVRHALSRAEFRTDVVRQVLAYGHFLFVGAVIAVAVGLAEVVHDPTHALHWSPAALLFGGAALYLATFGYTRHRMFGTWAVPRLTAAGVVLVLLPLAHVVPSLAALVLLALAMVTLNVVEHWKARQARSVEASHPPELSAPAGIADQPDTTSEPADR